MAKALLPLARALRLNQTEAEKKLWSKLRANRFYGLKFKRQEIIGGYIVDFICWTHHIIVECDGGQHSPETDKKRTEDIERHGFHILRYWNNDILTNCDGVLEDMKQHFGIQDEE